MFGPVGLPEILIILVVVLLLFGPRRLPEVGRTIGKALGEFRRATTDLKQTIDTEVRIEEVRQAPPATPAAPAAVPDAADTPVAAGAGPPPAAPPAAGPAQPESGGPHREAAD